MVHPCLLGSTVVRSQRIILPRTFCRYKSLTQAIEQGKQGYETPRRSRFGTDNVRSSRSENSLKRESRGSWRDRNTEQKREWTPREGGVQGRSYQGREGGQGDRRGRFPDSGSRGSSFQVRSNRGNPFEGRSNSGRPYEDRDNRGKAFEGTPDRARTFEDRSDSGRGLRERNDRGRREAEERIFPTSPHSGQRGEPPPQESARSFRKQDEDGGYQVRSPDRSNGFQERNERKGGIQQRSDDGRRFNRRDAGGHFQGRDDGRIPFQERDNGRRYEGRSDRGRPSQEHRGAREEHATNAPESLPYTTAASDFLYGYSSVLAALKANRRRIYKLYLHTRGQNNVGRDALVARARELRVNIQEVGDEYLRVLDKASSGRPHNGFVLETSPLPVPPITELRSSSVADATFEITLDKQSKEDAVINGTQEKYAYKPAGWRHPLILYVDGVLDEGNLGAIARSAYFLGVDAIVTSLRQCAPWSHIALKASAGAAEAIPIFSVAHAVEFLGKSAREGWRIYASDAVPLAEQRPFTDSSSGDAVPNNFASAVIYTYARSSRRLPADHCPVDSHPTILMMGSESTGLKASLLNTAHYKVGIRHGREVNEVGVDSLNVSVAASLLCYEVLQRPKQERKPRDLLF